MITINLYDYRQELKNVAIQKQVVAAAGVVAVFLFLIGASWVVEDVGRDNLKAEISEVEGKVKALEGKVKIVQTMKVKQKRIQQIVAGIKALRTGQRLTMTRLLDDVSQALPDGVWLERLMQAKWQDLEKQKVPVIFVKDPAEKEKPRDKKEEEVGNFIEIKGKTHSSAAIARFIEELEKIHYFKTVFLFKSELEEGESTPTHRFKVYCYLGEMKDAT